MKCYLLIRHKVRNYSNWREEFDSQLEWRRKKGERNIQVFRDEHNEQMVTLISEWDSEQILKDFIEDPQLSESMQIAGVMEQPIIYFLRKD